MRGLVRVALIASLSGCSFIAAHPPPSTPEAGTPRCNPGKGTVAVDGVVAGGLGIGALVGAKNSASFALGTGLVAAVYLGSALYGNWSANQCRKAMDDADRQLERQEDSSQAEAQAEVKEVAKAAPPLPPAPATQPSEPPQTQPTTTTTTTTSTTTSTSTSTSADPWSDFWEGQ